VPVGQLVAVVALISAAILLAKIGMASRAADESAAAARRMTLVAGTDTAPTSAPTAGEAIGAFSVRTLHDAVEAVAVPGRATIVMVSSETCGWCKRALADLGEMAAGRPLPNLTLLTLEGAREGVPMLEKEGIVGARLVGPAGSSDQVLLTFRYPGTPTFVAIDRNGRVVKTMPGYPIREEMRHWFAVMVGDQETP
jgi:thioredoxin-related protein